MKKLKINWFIVVAGVLMLAAIAKEFDAQLSIDPAEVQAAQAAIKPVTVDALGALLAQDTAPRQFVFIYASWCSVCHQVLPYALQALSGKTDVSVYMVAMEKDQEKLAKFLAELKLNGAFTPYLVNPVQIEEVAKLIKHYGGNYTGAIPYLLLLKKSAFEVDSTGRGIDGVVAAISR